MFVITKLAFKVDRKKLNSALNNATSNVREWLFHFDYETSLFFLEITVVV